MPHLAGRFHETLVIFSIFVSIVVSFTAFDLIDRIVYTGRRTLKFLLYAAFVMGVGLWSMHFVGMLALDLDVPVTYHVQLLLLSLVLPIAASLMALYLFTDPDVKRWKMVGGGLFIGLAVVFMHYMGMMAMDIPARITYPPLSVAASVLFALSVSFISLLISVRFHAKGYKHIPMKTKVIGSLLIGLAIAGVHYASVAGVVINRTPVDMAKAGLPVIGNSILAVIVGGTTLFLLASVITAAYLDRHQALRMAAEQEQRYMLFFEHSPDMVLCYDPTDNRIVKANPAVYAITGYTEEELNGMSWRQLFDSERELAAVREHYRNAVYEGNPRKLEFTITSRAGRQLLLSASFFPLFVEGKSYIYSIARDVTDKHHSEIELVRAKEEAENANRVKGEFLAIMSHEIRTPLNGIIGINQLLMETELTDKQREMLLVQEKSGQALLRVINDVLDFSKIESGTVTLAEEPFHLAGCVQECAETFSVTAQNKGLELDYRVDEHIPLLVLGDSVRLSQILLNLIGNAVKFTESGSVTLEATLAEPPGGTGGQEAVVEFKVTDTGIGIDPSRMHLLFLPFSQIMNASKARNYEGTGLGLAICRNLVELMGGEIWVEAGRKKGAAFGFRLPFRILESEQSAS